MTVAECSARTKPIHRFARGETIFGEGDACERIYKIVSGIVRICRFLPDGKRHIGDFLLEGDLIGLFEGDIWPMTGEAVTEVTVMSYAKESFEHIADAAVQKEYVQHLSDSLHRARRQIFVLGSQNAKERIASFLLHLSERTSVSADATLDLPMCRQDIADHLGLAVETVSRTISALKAEGSIQLGRANRLSLNTPALRALANTDGA
jgi:CRP/FNR family nitrogen fixation transcriptional regulator